MAKCKPQHTRLLRHKPGLFGASSPSIQLSLTDSVTLVEFLNFNNQANLADSIALVEVLTLELNANCTTLFRVPSRQVRFKVPIPRID